MTSRILLRIMKAGLELAAVHKTALVQTRIYESTLGASLNILIPVTLSESNDRRIIAANAAELPELIQKQFASLFDDAPQVPYSTIHRVFVGELGQPPSRPNGVFEVFEERAVSSASLAHLHKAKLWPTHDESGL
uniref:ABC1 atypical kinase-like domain-containing protein n=1 Tax=Psilocybe cubensis TaxID=181762 RepID=A0A8H7XM91_PSICU